ncbi:biopolymer transporter ExbB [Brucella anthropi]|uniref:tonB-system energizer ExbB n=1 Tax=Brucella anthropi TaxID=529 RepID=UPI000448D7E5|nr:tonB-system energizer ExbB [Brucella anthropi]EXL01663.1 biopolymer transporter ExbB [Brucella anthropi]
MPVRPADRNSNSQPRRFPLRFIASAAAFAVTAMIAITPALAQENVGVQPGQSPTETVERTESAPESTPEGAIVSGDPVTTTGGQPVAGASDRQVTGDAETAPVAAEGVVSDTVGTTPAATQDAANDAMAAADDATESATIEEPAPSLLEDPAGAILHMLASSERRADLPHDLSPVGMFMAADWVVKAVMIGLAFASLATWTISIAKSIELAGAKARAGRTLKAIRASKTLAEALGHNGTRRGPAALMLRAAQEETELSEEAIDHAGGGGVKERVSSVLGRIEAFAGRKISKETGILATIGSVSPFVGLFGTVWGIMNSFIGISESQTTNLAVVAPGIAEALLATAIGLVAAIPAVVIYNVFARSITGYRQLLADVASGVERLVSRDLDFRKVPGKTTENAASALAAE